MRGKDAQQGGVRLDGRSPEEDGFELNVWTSKQTDSEVYRNRTQKICVASQLQAHKAHTVYTRYPVMIDATGLLH